MSQNSLMRLFFAVGISACLSVLFASCDREQTTHRVAAIRPASGLSTPNDAVARVGDRFITTAEVEAQFNKMSAFTRSHYTSVPQRKAYVDNMVRFELLAHEAQSKGYTEDPDVIRAMKQQSVAKYLQKTFEHDYKIEDVSLADVLKYYEAHKAEFVQVDAVRISQIKVKDEAKSQKAYAAARLLTRGDDKAFLSLIERFSDDNVTKANGGDMSFLQRDSRLPKQLIDSAFALKEVGEISPIIKSDGGFHILKLTARRTGAVRPLSEVEPEIRQRVFRDMRTIKMEALIARLRQDSNAQVFEEKLVDLKVNSPVAAGTTKPEPADAPASPSHQPLSTPNH